MFKTARELAYLGVMTALLIAAQIALAGIGGIEVVTVLFLAYCVVFGVLRGLAVATAFSLLRCLIWGFFPTVIVLYLVYYNLFAVVFGLLGRPVKGLKPVLALSILIVCACVMTVFFTMLDNLITPLFYGMTIKGAKAYFLSSLPFMFRQTACACITVAALYFPLYKTFSLIKKAASAH